MKHTENLTKRHIYSKIQNTSVIFLNHSRVIVHTIAKWCKKMHSGIFNVSSLLLLVSPKFFGTTASARRSLKMKKFTKTAGVSNGRFAAIIGVLATALIITACGGGGGGSATDLVVTPPPVIVTPPVVFVFSCWNGTILSGTVQPTKVACAPVPDSSIKAVITGTTLTLTGIPTNATLASSAVTAQSGGSVVTWSNGAITSGTMLFSATYTYTGGKLTFSNVPDLTIAGSFTTGANPTACTLPAMKNSLGACISPPAATGYTWNAGLGAWVANVGVKVVGTNELPAGCTFWADQCWKDSVANGTVKFIATPALMIGYNNRPVVFAYYRLFSTVFKVNAWNYLAIYADDGSLVGSNISGGSREEIDFAQGSAKGVIVHSKPTGDCYEMAWNSPQKLWMVNGGTNTLPITCPN